MRSLTSEIQVGNYLVFQRRKAFLIRGCSAQMRRKFALSKIRRGVWSLSGKGLSGERVRRRFEAGALEEAIEQAEKILFGKVSQLPEDGLLIPDVFTRWVDTLSIEAGTRRNYIVYTGFFLDWCEAQGLRYWQDLKLEHLEAYATGLARRGLGQRTIKLYCQPPRTSARWASRNWPERFRDFGNGFKLPKPQREFLLAEQEQRVSYSIARVGEFLLWLRDYSKGWKLIPGVALQGLCGLRIREVLRLSWDRVDLVAGTITVEGKVKNEHSVRRLPLPLLVRRILMEAPRQSSMVLCGYRSEGTYTEAVRNAYRKWDSGSVIEPKGFRRTLASEAIRNGWDGFALERYLGHSPKSITEKHYVSMTQDEFQKLLRDQVVRRVDDALERCLEKWQINVNETTFANAA